MRFPQFETVYSTEVILARVAELANEVEAKLGDRDPLVVSLLSGSYLFVADFVRAVERPLRYEFVEAHYREGDSDDCPLEIHFPIAVDVADELILLVKDVVDTGLTEQYLRSELEERGASEVRIAALIDMPSERKNDVTVDFRAFEAERQGKLAGYGMKCDGLYGNLPFIARMLPEDETGIPTGSTRF